MTFSPDFTGGNFTPETISLPEDPQELRSALNSILEEHARFINRKEMGQYETVEIQNNQTFPGINPQTKNSIFRKIINTGQLPVAASNSIAHNIAGISNSWSFTRIWGTAFNPTLTQWIPLPNGGPAFEVQLEIDATNVNITTSVDLSAFTTSTVILEFYKGGP